MNIWGLKQKLKGYKIELKNLMKNRNRGLSEVTILQRKINLYKNLLLKERELRKKKK
jgi:hypothetical protein